MDKLQYRLEVFEGPLDLLLALVAKNKIDIYDIPIAELLEQYLEQIDLMREADMDVASEFLTMAARLVLIKTASLLPPAGGRRGSPPGADRAAHRVSAVQAGGGAAAGAGGF